MASKPVLLAKFHSDSNMALLTESLDYLIPSNFWEVDRNKLTVTFYRDHENLNKVKDRAYDLGADIYD